jgi:hypothetical protein
MRGFVVVVRAGLAAALFALCAASCVDGEARLRCLLTECNGECVDVQKSREH